MYSRVVFFNLGNFQRLVASNPPHRILAQSGINDEMAQTETGVAFSFIDPTLRDVPYRLKKPEI